MTTPAPMSMMTTPRAPLDEAALRALRGRIDRGRAAAASVDGGYEVLDGQADDALHSLLVGMSTMIGRVDQGYGVWAALEALHAASDGLGASTAEVADVSELVRTGTGGAPAMLVEVGDTTPPPCWSRTPGVITTPGWPS